MVIHEKISTLTAISYIDKIIDCEKIMNYVCENNLCYEQTIENNNSLIGTVRYPLSKKKDKIKEFKNQIQLHIPLHGENKKIRQVKIKVFNNGRLHMTGLQSVDMVKNVHTKLNEFLIQCNVIDVPFDEEIAYSKVEIVMINMTIDVGFKVNQKLFRDLLINKYNIYAEFSPKTYAGINAIYEVDGLKQASFLIFQSGKINIAGARGLFHLYAAKSCIENIIIKEKSNIAMI